MATEMSPACFPADTVMKGEYLERLPQDTASEMLDEFRDHAEHEAADTLREESDYWHGMSIVGPEWFFTED